MGNLVGRGFTHPTEPSVGNILTQVEGLIDRQSNDFSELNAFITELKNIRKTVADNERAFYTKLGVSGLEELNSKLDQIDNEYACMLAGGSIISEIRDKYDFNKINKHMTAEEITDAMDNALQEYLESPGADMRVLEQILSKVNSDIGKRDAVLKYIQQNLALDGSKFITTRGKDIVGLGKIVVGYEPAHDDQPAHFVVELEEGIKFSSDFVKRIETILEALNKKIGRQNRIVAKDLDAEVFKKQINDIIKCFFRGTTAAPYINYVLDHRTGTANSPSDYDLHPNISSVTGYLGEVRATAILHQIFQNANAIGTGSMRMVKTGQEIPIDIICADCGFQVKNYSLLDDTVTFSNKLSTVGWIDGRLCLSGTIRDILLDLFGVYQYNQPFEFSEDHNKPLPLGLEQYTTMYNSINNDANSLFYQLKPLFDARIPHMLKIGSIFSVENSTWFSEETTYFNTFFWINSKLVPSSYILDALIQEFSKHNQNSIFHTAYTLNPPTDKNYTFQKRDNLVGKDNTEAARKIKVRYEIQIDLSHITSKVKTHK